MLADTDYQVGGTGDCRDQLIETLYYMSQNQSL